MARSKRSPIIPAILLLISSTACAMVTSAILLSAGGLRNSLVLDHVRRNAIVAFATASAVLSIAALVSLLKSTGRDSAKSGAGRKNSSDEDIETLRERVEYLERLLNAPPSAGKVEKDGLDPGFLAELEAGDGASADESDPNMAGDYTPVGGDEKVDEEQEDE